MVGASGVGDVDARDPEVELGGADVEPAPVQARVVVERGGVPGGFEGVA